MSFLLDTNIVSEGMKPRPNLRVQQWLQDQKDEELFLSVMTIAELRQGLALAPLDRKVALGQWLEGTLLPHFAGRILDVTMPVAEVWGELAAEARKRGFALEAVDAFIAATARAHSLVVATRNIRDFMPFGVETFNPFELV